MTNLINIKKLWKSNHFKCIFLLIIILLFGILLDISEKDNISNIYKKDLISENISYQYVNLLYSNKNKECIDVTIRGAVKYNKSYAVNRNTTLYDLIKLAGGYSEDVDLNQLPQNVFLKEKRTYYIKKLQNNFKEENKKDKFDDVNLKKNDYFKQYTNNKTTNLKSEKPKFIEIEILGAVNKPGVYKLKYGSRLNDLIELAKGYSQDAKRIEKNYFLKDGQTFYVHSNKSRGY